MDIKDSGKRQEFEKGAMRDIQEGKPRIDLICPYFQRRLGMQLAGGADKYDERNWEKGMPQSRFEASLHRHLASYMAGETDEDHLAAMAFNLMGIISQEERFKNGKLNNVWDDVGGVRRLKRSRAEAATEGLSDGSHNGKP